MSIVDVLLVGVALSMDAFAVSVGKGLAMRRVDLRATLAMAVSFGLFQAGMPLAGWFLASTFAAQVQAVSGWIAFALLAAIGGKMLWDGVHQDDSAADDAASAGIGFGELMLLSVATSIDAFAVGVGFGVLGVPPFPAVAIIGCITFALSFAGTAAGNRIGAGFGRPATIAGGAILVLIGLKTLLLP